MTRYIIDLEDQSVTIGLFVLILLFSDHNLSKEAHLSILTRAGDWKLAGLEYVCASDAQPPAKILPCLEKYNHDGVDDGDVDDNEDDHDEEDTDYLPGKRSVPLSSLTQFMRV